MSRLGALVGITVSGTRLGLERPLKVSKKAIVFFQSYGGAFRRFVSPKVVKMAFYECAAQRKSLGSGSFRKAP